MEAHICMAGWILAAFYDEGKRIVTCIVGGLTDRMPLRS